MKNILPTVGIRLTIDALQGVCESVMAERVARLIKSILRHAGVGRFSVFL